MKSTRVAVLEAALKKIVAMYDDWRHYGKEDGVDPAIYLHDASFTAKYALKSGD